MDRVELAEIVATYLNDRDDIAATKTSESQITVETQGGQYFAIEIGPGTAPVEDAES